VPYRYRYHDSRRYRYGKRAGSEEARRHIREAEAFSRQMGGTDRDVKQYFFSLEKQQLEPILIEYGKLHGSDAEQYARETLPKWRSGTVKMSGMVAKRLFSLLPPRMPLKDKYQLAENVWRHFGPSSRHAFTIGPNTNIEELALRVSEKLDERVTKFSIPENVRNRFDWLAAGDIQLAEKLLNHFRLAQKTLAVKKVRADVATLQRRAGERDGVSVRARSNIQIDKHQVDVWLDKSMDAELVEGRPIVPTNTSDSGFWGCAIFVVLFLAVIFIALS